jgi:glycosyltransferase involved in cell wall biosynthesis
MIDESSSTIWNPSALEQDRLSLSIVVPLYDEEKNVRPLKDAVCAALGDSTAWELILVDDGSRDMTATRALELSSADPRVVLVRLARNYGQSAALQAGFDHARGDIVVTMDGDLQNDPRDIPRLVAKLHEGYDLVAGYRRARKDAFITRRAPSWVANHILRTTTGVAIRDTGCSLRAYRRELIHRMHVYSDLHRFLPAVAAATTGARITEIPVRHHTRRFGKSKYGLSRVLKVQLDLLTIKMIHSFRERPLILFAEASLVAMLAGLAFGAATMFTAATSPSAAQPTVFPAAALLWLVLSCYLLLLGLVGEVALRQLRHEAIDPGSIIWEERF